MLIAFCAFCGWMIIIFIVLTVARTLAFRLQ